MNPAKTVPGWVSKVLGTLFLMAMVSITINFVLSQTVLSSGYLDARLKKVHAYDQLSTAITDEITKKSGADPATIAKVQDIVTPEVLEQRIPGVLKQFEDYTKNGGAAPQIDVSDLVEQARAAGIEIPADSNLDQPISLADGVGSIKLDQTSKQAGQLNTLAIVAAGVLGAALLLVCWLRRDFTIFPVLAIVYGAIFIVGAFFLWVVPSALSSHFHIGDGNVFASVGQTVATDIAKDIGKRFGVIGGIALAAGVAGRIILARLRKPAPIPAKAKR